MPVDVNPLDSQYSYQFDPFKTRFLKSGYLGNSVLGAFICYVVRCDTVLELDPLNARRNLPG